MLTEELIEEEEDIEFEQEELNNYQQSVWPQGDWLKQKVVFTNPSRQNSGAVKEMAENRKLDYVFDRSAEIWSSIRKKYDISNLVVKYINQKGKKQERNSLNLKTRAKCCPSKGHRKT